MRGRQVRLALHRWNNRLLVKAVNKWRVVSKGDGLTQRAKGLLEHSILHWWNQEVSRGFLIWRIYTESILYLQEIMWRAEHRWLHKNLNAGIVSWMLKTQFSARKHAIMAKATKKWKTSQMSVLVFKWRTNTQWILEAEQTGHDAYCKMMIQACIMSWRSYISSRSLNSYYLAFGKQHWEVTQARYLMLRLFGKIYDARMRLQSLVKASQHHKSHSLACCIDRLDAMVVEQRQVQRQAQKAIYHNQLMSKQRSFDHLQKYASDAIAYADRTQNLFVLHLQRYFLRGVVQKLRNAVYWTRRNAKNDRRAQEHLAYVSQWNGMDDWNRTARAKKRYIAKSRRLAARAIAKAIEDWNLRHLGGAVDQWLWFAEESAEAAKVLAEGRACFSIRTLSDAVVLWRSCADYQSYVRGLADRAQQWWLNRSLAEAFVAWQQDMVNAIEAQQAHEAAVLHQIRQYYIYGLNIWQHKAQMWHEEKLARDKAQRVGVRFWDTTMQALASNRINDEAQLNMEKQRLLSSAQFHYGQVHTRQMLEIWMDRAEASRDAQLLYRESILHWALVELTEKLNKWRMIAWQSSIGGRAMLQSVSSWQGANIYVCLSLWRDWASWLRDEEQSEGYGVAAAIEHWETQQKIRAVLWLRRLAHGDEESRYRLTNAEKMWETRAMDVVFVRWRDYTYFYYELLEFMAQGSFRYYHKCLSDVFTHWRSSDRGVGKTPVLSFGEPLSRGPMAPMTGLFSETLSPEDPLDRNFEAQYAGGR